MRFVHSLDDSLFVHVAGLLAAAVAGMTAVFSGHVILDTANPASEEPVVLDSALSVDTGAIDSGDPTPLCDRVRTKEADVDEMNAQIDAILEDVKSRQRRR